MSYLQTLQQHNASIQSLIDTANNLPEAGSGSDRSVETCTIHISCSTSDIKGYVYTKVIDGVISMVSSGYSTADATLDVVLKDVLCGSFIFICTSIIKGFLSVSIDGDATFELAPSSGSAFTNVVIQAPSVTSYSTVTLVNND